MRPKPPILSAAIVVAIPICSVIAPGAIDSALGQNLPSNVPAGTGTATTGTFPTTPSATTAPLSVRFDPIVLLVASVFASFARLPIDATDLPDHKPGGRRNKFNPASFVFGLLTNVANWRFAGDSNGGGMPLKIC